MPRRGGLPPIEPIERLDLLCERVEELHRRRLIRGGFGAGLTITGTPAQAVMAVTSPDKDDLDAYLTSLRHLVSSGEPVFLGGILSIAYRHITDSEMREAVVRLRRWWGEIQSDRTFVVKQGDRTLIAKDVFDLYVNARVFHGRDPDSARLLRQIEDRALPPFAVTC